LREASVARRSGPSSPSLCSSPTHSVLFCAFLIAPPAYALACPWPPTSCRKRSVACAARAHPVCGQVAAAASHGWSRGGSPIQSVSFTGVQNGIQRSGPCVAREFCIGCGRRATRACERMENQRAFSRNE
jgi:hypothetical protein